jgi:hypothetical protein
MIESFDATPEANSGKAFGESIVDRHRVPVRLYMKKFPREYLK